MAKKENTNEAPKNSNGKTGLAKTVVALTEVVARYFAAYLLFSNFDHVIVNVLAWYLLLTATGTFVVIFYKAFNK